MQDRTILDLDAIEQAALNLYGREHGIAPSDVAAAFDAAGWRTRTSYRKRASQADARLPLEVAQRIFAAFAEIPLDDDGRTREAFRQFPAGSRREAVWCWLETACPAFSVAQEIGCGR